MWELFRIEIRDIYLHLADALWINERMEMNENYACFACT